MKGKTRKVCKVNADFLFRASIYFFCATDVKLLTKTAFLTNFFDRLSFFRYCDPPFFFTTQSDSSEIITERGFFHVSWFVVPKRFGGFVNSHVLVTKFLFRH